MERKLTPLTRGLSLYLLLLISTFQFTFGNSEHDNDHPKSYWDFDKVETQQIFARDGADGDYYGRGLAICGDRIVIGSSLDTFRGVQSGTAYVYSRGGATYEWNVMGKLYPSLGTDDDHFGWSVACDQNHTIVGAYGDDFTFENGGAVYLYTTVDGKFVEDGIFYPSGQEINEYFGWSVAIHGNLVVIGAKGNSELYKQCGAVYIFRKVDPTEALIDGQDDDTIPDGWVLDDILVPNIQSPYMNYGWSVSLYKNTLVVGAPKSDSGTGSVYVYTRNKTYDNFDDDQYYSNVAISYELVSVLESPYPQYKSFFGCSVSIHENLIVVGQYLRVVDLTGREINGGDDDSTYEITAGSAFVYRKDTINQIGSKKYPSPYLQQWGVIADLGEMVGYKDYEMFGYSVAVYHDLIAIGAPGDSVVRVNSSVYIYSSNGKDNFQHWKPITSGWGEFKSDRQIGKLGSSIALSEGLVIIGDTECYNENNLQTGCAYSWWGVHQKDDNEGSTPPQEIILSTSFEPVWITLIILISLGFCCFCIISLYRERKDTVEVVLEDMMSVESQKMPYYDNSMSRSGLGSSHLPEWLHRYSNHTNDWLFGGNEMKPIRFSADMDDSESSLNTSRTSLQPSSSGGLLNFMQRSNPSHSTPYASSSAASASTPSALLERRNRNRSDLRRIMATAKAIADDDSHPNQDEVSELIRTHDRDWITDEKFIEEVQRYF